MAIDIEKELGRAVEKVFPFTIRAVETRHFTSSSIQFRKTFLDGRPEGETWYAYDVIVHSRTKVEFVVFGMRDLLYGGIGDEVFRFEEVVDAKLTKRPYDKRVYDLATQIFNEKARLEELEEIKHYAGRIRNMAR